jgi:hypothetical protein
MALAICKASNLRRAYVRFHKGISSMTTGSGPWTVENIAKLKAEVEHRLAELRCGTCQLV